MSKLYRRESRNAYSDEMEYIIHALEDWREAIVHFDGALNWENPEMLLSIFLFVSIIFGLFWIFEPSFLMTIGLIGIFVSSADYFGPKILKRYLTGSWTRTKERRYEDFCIRLLHAKNHCIRGLNFLLELRVCRPYSYFMLITPLLIIFTILGWRINNLLIGYLTTTFFLLVPGLRYKGILQIFTGRFIPFLKRCVWGKEEEVNPGHLHPKFNWDQVNKKIY